MAETGTCPLCGVPIRFVELRPDGETIALDTIPAVNAPYRLIGESQSAAERVTMPGFQGYTRHSETCHKQQ